MQIRFVWVNSDYYIQNLLVINDKQYVAYVINKIIV